MKFTAPAGQFIDALRSVQARAKNNSLELLRHIRCDLTGHRLTLLGHDTSSSSEAFLDVDGATDGSCCVPTDSIVKLIGSLPKEIHVVVGRQDHQVTIKAGRSRYKLPILDSDGFPGPMPCDGGASVVLNAEDIQQLFVRPRGALDPKDQRAFAMGAYLHSRDGALVSAGLSTFHFVRFSSAAKLPELSGVIVPLSALDEIAKLGGNGGQLTVSDRSIAFEVAGRRYCSKLVDTKYPDYGVHLPKPNTSYVEVDREDLLLAARRLSSIASAESAIDLTFGAGEITAWISGMGDGAETIHSSGEAPPDTLVSISAGRLVELLEMPGGEVIQIHTYSPQPILLIVDPSEASAIYVESGRVPKAMRRAA